MKTGDLVKYKMVLHDNFQHWVGLLTSFGCDKQGHPATAWVMWNIDDYSGRPMEEWVDELEVIR